MNGCTPTDKPLISILLAVYEPREDWLREQLLSLEAQTYPHKKLFVRDDASRIFSYDRLCALVRECISFPAEISRSERNEGSNAVFAALSERAEGEYFAFCDQDDIWLPEKLESLLEAAEAEGAQLVCSDQEIIDENGAVIASDMGSLRRHHVFRSGEGLAGSIWQRNFASGCAMLVRADTVRDCLPFNPYMVYDHYIAMMCADRGRVISLPETLVRHREHSENQSSLLRGVTDKESYTRIRVEKKLAAAAWLREYAPMSETLSDTIAQAESWLEARARYAGGERGAAKGMLRHASLGRKETAFELLLPLLPERIITLMTALARKNRL